MSDLAKQVDKLTAERNEWMRLHAAECHRRNAAEQDRNIAENRAKVEEMATRKREEMLREIAAAVGEEFNPLPTLASRVISSVAALEAERDEWKREADKLAEHNRKAAKTYYDIADATLPSSSGPQDIITEIYRLREAERTAESRLASARVEGAREFVARYVSANNSPDMTDRFFHFLRDLESFRDREYPAPAAPAGEQTRRDVEQAYGALADTLARMPEPTITRPAPTPEPEPLVFDVNVSSDGDWWHTMRVTLPPDVTRRIVALGSRPTQTAEG